MTTLPRAILDLCMPTSFRQRDRMFRDAIRLRRTTREELKAIADAHRGHRGAGRLRELLGKYEAIPIERTRSDAEVEGLVVLERAGLELPSVNVPVAGFEADFVDFKNMRILELDGKQSHQFPERDEERNAAWRAAGFTVQRRPTDDAYDDEASVLRGMAGEDEPEAA
ncbi:MAG: DUF559 domain-containing protein [Solirubrobacteraceae bacterium]|nr:DUF559 domain-containing protein [Solirubrobacteraceae bacterium]